VCIGFPDLIGGPVDPCSLTGRAAQLSSQTAREWTSRFYRKAGIKVSKVSHAPRVAATQNADIAGVDEGQACHHPDGEPPAAG
jgi:hypothetical protein